MPAVTTLAAINRFLMKRDPSPRLAENASANGASCRFKRKISVFHSAIAAGVAAPRVTAA